MDKEWAERMSTKEKWELPRVERAPKEGIPMSTLPSGFL